MSDTLVPEPQASIFDSVAKALGNDDAAARRVMLNPNLTKGFKLEHAVVPKNRMTASR